MCWGVSRLTSQHVDITFAVRYLASMNRRIILFLVVAAVLVFPALAAAKAPAIQSFKIYRTPSGPDRGALTVITTLDYQGFAKAADFPTGTISPASRASVTLTGANSTITARDVVRLHPGIRAGAPVRFDFRIPAAKARTLGDRKVKIAFAVSLRGRTTSFATKSTRATRQIGPFPCFLFCPVNTSPPPAPSVAFGESVENPTLCLGFSSGYSQPSLYQIAANDADDNILYGGGNSTFAVSTDGTFSDVGVEQPASNPGTGDVTVTFSGTVPTSVLNAAPTASTGTAFMYNSGAPWGLFTNPIVAPYLSNNNWC